MPVVITATAPTKLLSDPFHAFFVIAPSGLLAMFVKQSPVVRQKAQKKLQQINGQFNLEKESSHILLAGSFGHEEGFQDFKMIAMKGRHPQHR